MCWFYIVSGSGTAVDPYTGEPIINPRNDTEFDNLYTSKASFTNITVTNDVEGSQANPDKYFKFKIDIEGEDFFDMKKYAGEGNIGHIIEEIKRDLVLASQLKNKPQEIKAKLLELPKIEESADTTLTAEDVETNEVSQVENTTIEEIS